MPPERSLSPRALPAQALFIALAADMSLLLRAAAAAAQTFARYRPGGTDPPADGAPAGAGGCLAWVKANAVEGVLQAAVGGRAALLRAAGGVLRDALLAALVEDGGGACKHIAAVEVPGVP